MVAAPQIQYRQEMIATFEVRKSLLLDTVTTEAVIKGNQATFLVTGSGGATAVTRGVNGKIPARQNSNTQTTVTLSEWHDVVEMTGFDIFASQGNQRSAMQKESVGTINRKIDSQILTELNTGTVDTGGAATASEALAIKSLTILQLGKVPWDSNIFAIISPAFNGYLLQVDSYSSADYVSSRPMVTNDNGWSDMPKMKQWLGVNWIVHPEVPGVGTNAEKCFMFHKSAIGYAMETGGMKTAIGYDDRDDFSWARATIFSGVELLQNSGVVVMNHDGSAYVGA